MAIDTPAKRRAMMAMTMPILPIPSGTSTPTSRFTYLRLYYISPVIVAVRFIVNAVVAIRLRTNAPVAIRLQADANVEIAH